jgi:DNA-damage-inducible protein J
MMKNLNIQLDEHMFEQSENLFNELGLDLDEAVKIFLQTAIRYQGLPFELKRDEPYEKYVYNALLESQKEPKFVNLDDMFSKVDKIIEGSHDV